MSVKVIQPKKQIKPFNPLDIVIFEGPLDRLIDNYFDDWKYKQMLEFDGNSIFMIAIDIAQVKDAINNNTEIMAIGMTNKILDCLDELNKIDYFLKPFRKIFIVMHKTTILLEINFKDSDGVEDILVIKPNQE